MNNIRKIHRNNLFYLLAAIQVICIIVYHFALRDLEKPAGLREIFNFAVYSSGDMILSLVFGAVPWVIGMVLLMSLVSMIPIVKELLEDDNYWYSCYVSADI